MDENRTRDRVNEIMASALLNAGVRKDDIPKSRKITIQTTFKTNASIFKPDEAFLGKLLQTIEEQIRSVEKEMPVTPYESGNPSIDRTNPDKPLLIMSNHQLHWLTMWERLLVRLGFEDAVSLDLKHLIKQVKN